MALDKEIEDVEPRERSRDYKDKKFEELNKEELEERTKMKNRVLGLSKIELSQRHNLQYRNQLLF